MNKIIILLIIIVLATLLIAIGNVFGLIPSYLIEQSTLPAIAISAGVLIASITYLRDKASQATEGKRKSDEINLMLAKEGFDETYELLKDLNNNRITWLRAARILYSSIDLKNEIDLPQYKKAFSHAEERLKNQLYRVLQIKPNDPSLSDTASLPAQFFYGVDNWRDNDLSLDNAAISSSSPIKAYRVTIDRVTPETKSEGLSENSIVAIYNFLNYPENYSDPLSEIELWSGHFHDGFGIEQGPRRYIYHKKHRYVHEGKMHDRRKN
ncbi:MAG: hypothetical protein COA95_02910 [Methylophaga sp.]|nr:MAG: hypothetical protein COA95_02910 [Methylophaga sp.]